MHNRPKLKNRKSQKPTVSPEKQEEEEEEVVQAGVKTHEERGAAGDLSNSETGDIIDEEDAKMSGIEELEESNVSLFNDSSLEDFDFEEKEPEVGGNSVDDNAVDGPALSEVDEVEQVEANDMDEETGHNGEEEATASKGGATDADFPKPKEDQERETEEEVLEDGRPTERTSGLLDLKASEYFTKYPKAIANPQVCDLFNDVLLRLEAPLSILSSRRDL